MTAEDNRLQDLLQRFRSLRQKGDSEVAEAYQEWLNAKTVTDTSKASKKTMDVIKATLREQEEVAAFLEGYQQAKRLESVKNFGRFVYYLENPGPPVSVPEDSSQWLDDYFQQAQAEQLKLNPEDPSDIPKWNYWKGVLSAINAVKEQMQDDRKS